METVVADPKWVSPTMWVGFPLAGAGVGVLLKAIAGWVASLEWAPLQGPFRLLASIAEPQATIGSLAVGALLGLILAVIAASESVAVTVADDRVTIRRGSDERRFDREPVRAVFVDGKHLVLLGPATEELLREKTDQPPGRIRDAFVAHGYPWHEDDPHGDEFRRWVDGTPGLPPGADALLKARAKALSDGDKNDAAQLRTELARLGLVVRDENKRQFWRARIAMKEPEVP